MRKVLALAVFASAAALTSSASAAPLVLDADWRTFYFGVSGSSIIDATTGDSVYSFTLNKAAVLKITDAFIPGDIFDFTLNGTSLGLTSTPNGNDATDNSADPAYANPAYSHGTYSLGAGSYTLTGIAALSPYGQGGAFIQLSSAVPEPATWSLMIVGFGAVGASLRGRRKATLAHA